MLRPTGKSAYMYSLTSQAYIELQLGYERGMYVCTTYIWKYKSSLVPIAQLNLVASDTCTRSPTFAFWWKVGYQAIYTMICIHLLVLAQAFVKIYFESNEICSKEIHVHVNAC